MPLLRSALALDRSCPYCGSQGLDPVVWQSAIPAKSLPCHQPMRAAYSGPLQVLLALANSRNRVPLPEPLKDCHGLRLPRDEDCLLASNYQFHPVNPPAEAMDVDDAQEYDGNCPHSAASLSFLKS